MQLTGGPALIRPISRSALWVFWRLHGALEPPAVQVVRNQPVAKIHQRPLRERRMRGPQATEHPLHTQVDQRVLHPLAVRDAQRSLCVRVMCASNAVSCAVQSTGGVHVFGFPMQVLDLPSNIEVFFRPDQPGELQIANTREKNWLIPSIVVGKGLLAGRSDKELAFPIGAFLAKMRPEQYLRQILPSHTELTVASQAVIRLARPDFEPLPQHAQLVEQYMTALSPHLPSAACEDLGVAAQKFITAGTQLYMAKWAQAVDLTAHRVGLILSSDLASAARAIEQEPMDAKGMEPKAKIKELILYASRPLAPEQPASPPHQGSAWRRWRPISS